MKSRRRVIALGVATTLLALSTVTPVSAGAARTTRWVDDDGKAGPTSCSGSRVAKKGIQAAVNASDTNDVIIVCPGTYTGSVRVAGNRRGLTIRGFSKYRAHLKAPRTLDEPLVWVLGVRDVTLKWLDLQFPTSGCGPREDDVNGIYALRASGVTINANQIRPLGSDTLGSCGYVDGIVVDRSKDARVTHNVVRDFTSDGIWFMHGSTGTIDANKVHYYHTGAGAGALGGQGITVHSSTAQVLKNTVRSYSRASASHLKEGIVAINASGTVKIDDNKVLYVETGIGSDDSISRITNNDIRGVGDTGANGQRGIHLFHKGGNAASANKVSGFEQGIQVETTGNSLKGNVVTGSILDDCVDETSGSGTAGTGNTWTANTGTGSSSPDGICPAP